MAPNRKKHFSKNKLYQTKISRDRSNKREKRTLHFHPKNRFKTSVAIRKTIASPIPSLATFSRSSTMAQNKKISKMVQTKKRSTYFIPTLLARTKPNRTIMETNQKQNSQRILQKQRRIQKSSQKSNTNKKTKQNVQIL